MPLESSGPISIGGSTVGRSINLELNRSATATSSLNEVDLRTLAGVPSGVISLANFYGKSSGSAWIFTTGISSEEDAFRGVVVNSSAVWVTGVTHYNRRILTIKLNLDGTIVWQRFINLIAYGYDYYDDAQSIAVDNNGNSYITGATYYNFSNSEDRDIFITKYDTNGIVQWQRVVVNSSPPYDSSFNANEHGNFITIDPNNSDAIYIAGQVSLDTDATGGFYVARYDSSGNLQWQKTTSIANNISYATSISVGINGNIFVSGIHQTFNDVEYYAIAKYSSTGTRQWLRVLRNQGTLFDTNYTYYSNPAKSIVTSYGNIYIHTQRTPGGSYPSEAILTKLDNDGNVIWQRGLAGESNFFFGSSGVAVDQYENAYICGYDYRSSPSLNDIPMYIAKYSSSGVLQWQRRLYGSPGNSVIPTNITISGDYLYISGQSDIRNFGSMDCILAKLKTDGSQTGTYYYSIRPVVYEINLYTAFTPNYTFESASYSEVSRTFASTSVSIASTTANLDTSIITQLT